MNEVLAAWVPGTVLVGILIAALKWIGGGLLQQLKDLKDGQKANAEAVTSLEKTVAASIANFATKDALGNMGDRFDGRFATMREDFGALRERVARLEGAK